MGYQASGAPVDPARAGMILVLGGPVVDWIRGPRASGDDPLEGIQLTAALEWTPRERG